MKGGLSQDVEWLALSEDRKEVIDTFVITENEDGTVKVMPTENTLEGNYVIVAYSEKYKAAKGINITVEEKKFANL